MKISNLKISIVFSVVVFLFVGYTSQAQYIQFIENKGQWNSLVNFAGELNGGGFFLEKNGYRVLLNSPEDWQQIADYYSAHNADSTTAEPVKKTVPASFMPAQPGDGGDSYQPQKFLLHSHAYEVTFSGASPAPEIVPDKALDMYNNYYIGNDKSKWASGCKIYQAVVYKNMYPNIDVRYYTYNNQLKYDIIVHEGGDVSNIVLEFKGVNGLSLKKGNLVVATSLGNVTELSPVSYQTSATSKAPVSVNFALSGNTVRFKAGSYDKSKTLIIDPTLIFSTFSGSTSDNWGYTATYDGFGNLYAGGIVFGSGFPTTLGAFDREFSGGDQAEGNGGIDIGIIKFNKTGSSILYGTYLGGDGDEQPHSLVVDGDGNLLIGGRTSSGDFPATVERYGPAGTNTAIDIFIAKLNSTGGLSASRRIGGSQNDGVNIRPKYVGAKGIVSLRRNYGDDARSEVLVDANRNVYLASCTQSSDFPVTDNAFQKQFGGGDQDGVIIKTSPDLRTILLSSHLGGTANDAAFVLALNPANNNIYVAGATVSNNLPDKEQQHTAIQYLQWW